MIFLRRYVLICTLLLFLPSGCGLATDPALVKAASQFATSVSILTKIIDQHYDDTEAAHKLALRDNFNLQFDLGGRPEVRIAPLFKLSERAARRSVLNAVKVYALQLSDALVGDTPEALVRAGEQSINGLRHLNADTINLSHSMNRFQTRELISSLSGFSKILLLPKRDRELAKIAAETQIYIKELATLFYVDIGTSDDETAKCRFSVADIKAESKLSSFTLCKGGLRGLMQTAFQSDRTTWQQRLNLSAVSDSPYADKRSQFIDHILDIEQSAKEEDALMKETQTALVLLIEAHASLARSLSSGKSPDLEGEGQFDVTEDVYQFAVHVAGLPARRASAARFLLKNLAE